MTVLPQVFFDSRKARDFNGFHPWVREQSLVEPTMAIDGGAAVELLSPGGGWIGRGIYNPSSRIRVRLYQWDRGLTLDANWCIGQVERAVALREKWMERHSRLSAVRLVNSEGDGLSGLIVDRFGEYLVIQVTALAMLNWLEPITEWLQQRLTPQGILLRIDEKTARHEGMQPRDELLRGQLPAGPLEIEENGVRIQLDLISAQKTGYYLDQRNNRVRATQWMDSGPMLDVCCYLGGFSLAACRAERVTSVLAVDSSTRALEQARINAELNGCAEKFEFAQVDCFDYLEKLVAEKRQFHTVVLDPPRMASNRGQLSSALRAYHRLNVAAVNLLVSGGTLVTCSCSGRVTRADVLGMLAAVSKRTRRSIQVVESHGADFDHPVDVNCPEGEYLKCLICRVG
jgi:23S rRNA (cytosine1962-C5)-methyltransferase